MCVCVCVCGGGGGGEGGNKRSGSSDLFYTYIWKEKLELLI